MFANIEVSKASDVEIESSDNKIVKIKRLKYFMATS